MSRPPQVILFAAAACIVLTTLARGDQQATASGTAPDVTKLGPQVGEPAPGFTLPDQTGRSRTLASLAGPKGLVLVFSRSADW